MKNVRRIVTFTPPFAPIALSCLTLLAACASLPDAAQSGAAKSTLLPVNATSLLAPPSAASPAPTISTFFSRLFPKAVNAPASPNADEAAAIVTPIANAMGAATSSVLTPPVSPNQANPATLASPTPPVVTDDPLPEVILTSELVFKLVTAEIAFQRGEWQTAYVTTLVVAQQTRDPRLAKRAAEMAIAARQNGEAMVAIRLWRELAPHSEEAAQYLLGFLVLSEEIDSTEPLLTERLAASPPTNRGLMLLQIQRMLARARDKAASLALVERLSAPYKDLAEAHIALAQAAFVSGDRPRAIEEARTALRLKNDSDLAILTLAQVLPDQAQVSEALATFLRAHPQSHDARLAQARLHIEQKQYAKARNDFAFLLKQRPDDLSSLYALGVLASQDNDPKEAEKFLSTYLDQLAQRPDEERDPSQALLILAHLAETRKDYATALSWLAQMPAGPSYLPAQIRRAQLIAKQGDLPAALRLLLAPAGSDAATQIQLFAAQAQLLREAGQLSEALALMKTAIDQFPQDPDLLYDYAMLAEKLEQLDIMETSLRRLIVLTPTNQHAFNALGYSFAERNIRLPEALQLIETALTFAPDDPFILDSLGWVQFRLGRLSEAQATLTRAYAQRQDIEIAAHLGEVLWASELQTQARAIWRDAHQRDPLNEVLKSTLTRLQIKL